MKKYSNLLPLHTHYKPTIITDVNLVHKPFRKKGGPKNTSIV